MNTLEKVKKGDYICYVKHSTNEHYIKQVERTTNTQIIVDGMRFRKKNGNLLGNNTWSSDYIAILDDKRKNLVNQTLELRTKTNLTRQIKALLEQNSYSLNDLNVILGILKK